MAPNVENDDTHAQDRNDSLLTERAGGHTTSESDGTAGRSSAPTPGGGKYLYPEQDEDTNKLLKKCDTSVFDEFPTAMTAFRAKIMSNTERQNECDHRCGCQ